MAPTGEKLRQDRLDVVGLAALDRLVPEQIPGSGGEAQQRSLFLWMPLRNHDAMPTTGLFSTRLPAEP